MADVGRAPAASGRCDRGQLILVTGLMIAVTMIALVLLLNTAIYTENLASRGADQSGREAIEYRATVVDSVGGLIDAENDREHASWGDVRDDVSAGIGDVDNMTARTRAIGGVAVEVNQSTVSLNEGRLIRQPANRPLENASGETDWPVASSVDGTRGFVLNVSRSSLTSTAGSQADANGAFAVHVDGSPDWWAYIYNDGGDIGVATTTAGSPTEVCSVSATSATIDLTGGTINGEPCNGLVWAEGVSGPYQLSFRDGNNASGTYNLTVDSTSLDTDHYGSVGSSPYHVPGVYSTTFELSYRSPSLTYRTTVRVAPGEPE